MARQNRHTILHTLKTTNPKLYWKNLNDWTSYMSDNKSMPSHDDFVKHFESLGNVDIDDLLDVSNDNDIQYPDLNTDRLNSDISNDEIMKHLKKQKTTKLIDVTKY